jgi:LPS-assembly lipoprotein
MPFARIAFNGFAPGSEMASQLRLMLNSSQSTRVVDDLLSADAILDVLVDSQERGRGTITPASQVRSINLLYRFKFRVRTNRGVEVLSPVELAAARSMTYNETQALGKEKEEAEIFRSMQTDLADQVLRRLAAIKLP